MRFSVIVPAYNASENLSATVRSALAQELGDLEVVISDDGSTDNTLDIAHALAAEDPRVIVVTGENGGCSVARNRAFAAASGEYAVLLDSDDQLLPGYLSAMSAFIDARPGRDIYSCNGIRRTADGSSEPFLSGAAYAAETSWTLDDIIIINHIFITAVLRRDLWERVGGYVEGLRYAEDYDFWLRALALGAKHIYTPQQLSIYLEQATGKSKNRIPHAEAQIGVFTRLSEMPELTDAQRRLCAEKIALLHTRIERVELEARLQRGEFAGARGAYLGVRRAYNSQAMYVGGLALMMVSPRLYARVFRARDSRRMGS